MKNQLLAIFLFIIGIGGLGLAGCQPNENACPETNCSDYISQQQAQAAFDSDPECFSDLDADNDHMACEDFKGYAPGNLGCPTTANCGYSGKRKSDCGGTCCRWEVGSGCQCT